MSKYTPDELKSEEWRNIPGYEGIYQVSNLGRVRSLARKNRAKTVVMSPYRMKNGYLTVRLSVKGDRTTYLVHRLVAMAFIGPCPVGREVNHINGDKSDNRPGNLHYVTHSYNLRHAYEVLGYSQNGEENTSAKITRRQVNEIRRLAATGRYTHRQIADRFPIKRTQVTRIINRTRW